MLLAVYGGSGSAKPYRRKSPAGDWEAAQAAREKKKQQNRGLGDDDFVWPGQDDRADAANNAYDRADAAWNDAKARARGPAFHNPHLRHLSEYFDNFGCLPLTKWEGDFMVNILNRSDWRYAPTPRQLDIISAILTKYRNFKQRNGDEQAFWKA